MNENLKLNHKKNRLAYCTLMLHNEEFQVQLELAEYERYLLKTNEIHDFLTLAKGIASQYFTPVMEQIAALDKAFNDRDALFEQMNELTTEKNKDIINRVKKSLDTAINFMLVDESERGTCALNELYDLNRLLNSISIDGNRDDILKIKEEIEKIVKSIIPKDSEDLNA